MKRALIRQFGNFVPESYYTMLANAWHLDTIKYPYSKVDFDPVHNRNVPFCVWDFDILNTDEGHKVAMALVTYKSIVSKTSFKVVAYL